MLYTLYANNKKIDSFKTLSKAMNVAQEDELVQINWEFLNKGIQATPTDTLYQIKRNPLPEISIELGLPNNVDCEGCDHFIHERAGQENPEYTDCSIKKLGECPVIVRNIS